MRILPSLLAIGFRLTGRLYSSGGRSGNSSSNSMSGRGAYYKNKYGGGRGGRGKSAGGRGTHGRGGRGGSTQRSQGHGGSYNDLNQLLQSIDGRQYPCYHDLETNSGCWSHALFELRVARTQADPFAPPTRCQIRVASSTANFPETLYSNKARSVASADYLWRKVYQKCLQLGADQTLQGSGWKGPKGGDVGVMAPTQHVIQQSAVSIENGAVVLQLTINLPARGRTILGSVAGKILNQTVQSLVEECLLSNSLNLDDMKNFVDSIEDQLWLQAQLESKNLVAFVRNGAVLPRASGVDDRPMKFNGIVPFKSPSSLQVEFTLPNLGTTVSGMGIPTGITLVCGGGFHGKSTLLETLQNAVYPKIPGDGREFCVTSESAFKIRSEDGRSVQSVDISSFISNLPFEKDTTDFCTADASGSTSQASNIVEAIELDTNCLLVDEDTCATNFMVRDQKMMELVACNKEPITPFVRIVESLKDQGISTVLVVGGTGDFFDVADHVLLMDSYHCSDVTDRAKEIVSETKSRGIDVPKATFSPPTKKRRLLSNSLDPNGKVRVPSTRTISYGDDLIDLGALEQLVSKSQTNAISRSLQVLSSTPAATLRLALQALEDRIEANGLNALAPGDYDGSLMKPRILEIGATLNRLRRDCLRSE